MVWPDGPAIRGVKIEEIDTDLLSDCLKALYELAYKYDQIDLHLWDEHRRMLVVVRTGSFMTKAEALAMAAAGILEVGVRALQMLRPIFVEWVRHHAITNPREWAVERVRMHQEARGFSLKDIMAEAWSEAIERHIQSGGLGFSLERSKAIDNIMTRDLPKHLDEMPKLRKVLSGPRSFYEDEPFELKEFLLAGKGMDDKTYEEVIVEFYEKMVFPIWYAVFKPKGIQETKQRIQRALHRIDSLIAGPTTVTPNRFAVEVDQIINIAHQGGPMIELIEETYEDVDLDLLDELSSMDTTTMDRELYSMGMSKVLDSSTIERRRARAEAQEILGEAWESLARRERGENPLLPLQKAVEKVIR